MLFALADQNALQTLRNEFASGMRRTDIKIRTDTKYKPKQEDMQYIFTNSLKIVEVVFPSMKYTKREYTDMILAGMKRSSSLESITVASYMQKDYLTPKLYTLPISSLSQTVKEIWYRHLAFGVKAGNYMTRTLQFFSSLEMFQMTNCSFYGHKGMLLAAALRYELEAFGNFEVSCLDLLYVVKQNPLAASRKELQVKLNSQGDFCSKKHSIALLNRIGNLKYGNDSFSQFSMANNDYIKKKVCCFR